jgi:flagellin-specific chaperone FliS
MTEALIEQDPEKLEAVARLLADLREAWAQIADQGMPGAGDAAAAR